jgi:protease I
MPSIADAKILIMATNRFEESELFGPRDILIAKGAEVTLASLDRADIMATIYDEPGRTITPDLTVAEARAEEFDALLLPGGVGNPDRLRSDAAAVALIKAFDAAKKPIGAICHAPWLLAEADVLRGRRATSWRSIRTDIRNAGAEVVDEAAVTDGHLVTSRSPDDVPDFTAALIAAIEATGGGEAS